MSESRVEAALGSGGRVIAYMVGSKCPNLAQNPVDREAIAAVFDAHDFEDSSKVLRNHGEARAALQQAVSRQAKPAAERLGRAVSNGSKVTFAVGALDADDSDVKSFGIWRHESRKGEKGRTTIYGARVYACPDGSIHVADPPDGAVNGQAHPECRQLAEFLASAAQDLTVHASGADISTAITASYSAAGCYSFISRGLYVAEHGTPDTDRLLACLEDIRDKFYDAARRAGVRTRVVRVTEADADALSDSVVDAVQADVAELVKQLRDYAGRDKAPGASTLTKRREECQKLLDQIKGHASLLGQWSAQFEAQAASLREGFEKAATVGISSLDLPDWADESYPEGGEPTVAPVVPVEPAAAPEAPPSDIQAKPEVTSEELDAFEL